MNGADSPLPLEMLARYRPLVGDWEAFVGSLGLPLSPCVWTNTARISPARLREILEADGLRPVPLAWNPTAFRLTPGAGIGNRWWYMAGLCHSQEEASLLPVALLDPRPGERVLDLCAAPGGKSAQIALALENRGTVIANDLSIARMRALRANSDRLGLVNVSATIHDGAAYPRDAGAFDRVLVDAPCSCEGTLRRQGLLSSRPRSRHAAMQTALLRRAVTLCRPGGRIVYSTCTFAPEENEAVVHGVLGEFGARLRVLPAAIANFATSPGVTTWAGQVFDPSLCHCLRVWPHRNDTGGFFVAVLEKTGDEAEPAAPIDAFAPLPAPELERVLVEHFGVPASMLEEWIVCRRSGRGLHLIHRSHRPCARPAPEAAGLPVIKTKSRPPKLTTAGALLVAPHARANVIDLYPEQMGCYFARQSFPVSADQTRCCTGRGYVIVCHQGLGLGTARFDPATHRVQSLFPKYWAGTAGR